MRSFDLFFAFDFRGLLDFYLHNVFILFVCQLGILRKKFDFEFRLV